MGTVEDAFVMPSAWLRAIRPRRGGAPADFRPSPTWAADVATLVAKRPSLRTSLGDARTPADIRDAGLAHLDGGATPLGAAAVVAAYAGPPDDRSRAAAAVFAEGWVAGHGLRFAVEAVMELQGLGYGADWRPTSRAGEPVVRRVRGSERAGAALGPVRAALAAAPDDEHRAVVELLGAWRERSATHRIVAAHLAPTEAAWVEREVRGRVVGDDWSTLLLLASVTTEAQAETLAGAYPPQELFTDTALLHTIADGLGTGAAPLFVGWFERFGGSADARRALPPIIAAMPTDAAFQALADRVDTRHVPAALAAASDRFPRRAVRLLAEAAGRRGIAERLRAHVAAHRDIAAEVLPALRGAAATRVAAALGALDRRTVAPPEALPPLLVTPPWAAPARKPVVVAGLCCTDPPGIAWEPGEQAEWLDRAGTAGQWGPLRSDWAALARDIDAGTCSWVDTFGFFMHAPMEVAAPVAARWRPNRRWDEERWSPALIARFGVLVLPLILDVDRVSRASTTPLLMPFTGPEVAAVVARRLGGGRPARRHAVDWLRRHPGSAARALVPAALGPAGPARRHAWQALRVVADLGRRDAVEAAARSYGAEAAAAVTELLDTDPLDVLPARPPALPGWVDPAALAPVELRGGAGTLPVDAVRHVLTMLAMSGPAEPYAGPEPYAGLAVVRQACTEASLGAFAVSLLERWLDAGAPARAGWVLEAQAFLGDDETARRLAEHVRAWPSEGALVRAVAAVDVIARIGTEGALTHLHRLATKVRTPSVRARAHERLAEVATALRLSPEQLADRLVPDLGLDAAGTLTIDYGSRRFTVGFDERLQPFVADETGARRRDLPRPGVRDDPALAPAAAKRFTVLKRDVRAVAAEQIPRFERAMVMGRRWTGAEFRRFIVGHPLVWHVARRLVWVVLDGSSAGPTGGSSVGGGLRTDDATTPSDAPSVAGVVAGSGAAGAVRVAEDRTFAGVDDTPVTVADDALIGVAHPLQLGEALGAWAELFADYAIVQPFPQLGRGDYSLTAEERDRDALARFTGVKVPTGRIAALTRGAWRRTEGHRHGYGGWIERDLPGGRAAVVELDPGLHFGDVSVDPFQTIAGVWVDARHPSGDGRCPVPIAELDPVGAFELVRDLEEATA
ncbi:DUF4132 domain-containing protein [Dactylosporangium sp. NPDC050688]|uniref:DUF4132 domain-containing protein n=1 Tax=Dactylosporangium sp. NPDC050688 TaxID=3157217 RepID=UPI0033F41966